MYLRYVWWRYLAYSLPKIRLRVPTGIFTWVRLTRLARFPRSRLISKFFVKFSICLYERAGWLGCRDLGFSNLDLDKRAGNFAILACEQALLFGGAKPVSRERASERRSREGQGKGPSAPRSHVLARLPQIGELARRLCHMNTSARSPG